MNLILDSLFFLIVCCAQHPAQFILDLKKGVPEKRNVTQNLSCQNSSKFFGQSSIRFVI